MCTRRAYFVKLHKVLNTLYLQLPLRRIFEDNITLALNNQTTLREETIEQTEKQLK